MIVVIDLLVRIIKEWSNGSDGKCVERERIEIFKDSQGSR